MFGKQWEPAEATIVLVNIRRYSGSGMTATLERAADVRKADGTVVRAKIDEPRIATNFWAPVAGDVVKGTQWGLGVGAVLATQMPPHLTSRR